MLESPYDERVHHGLSVAPPQPTPSGRPTYVVTHVDVIPPRAGDAVALLGQIADAGRKEAANNRFEVLQQTNRNNHFSIVELWQRKVFEARAATPGVIQFRNQLQPMIGALYDQRLLQDLGLTGAWQPRSSTRLQGLPKIDATASSRGARASPWRTNPWRSPTARCG